MVRRRYLWSLAGLTSIGNREDPDLRRLRDSRSTRPSCGGVHSWRGILGIMHIPCPGHDIKRSKKVEYFFDILCQLPSGR